MPELNGLRRSLVNLEPNGTLIALIDMSQSSWLVAGIIPGAERHPLKKLPADETALLQLLQRWRDEATKAGRAVQRVVVAFLPGGMVPKRTTSACCSEATRPLRVPTHSRTRV